MGGARNLKLRVGDEGQGGNIILCLGQIWTLFREHFITIKIFYGAAGERGKGRRARARGHLPPPPSGAAHVPSSYSTPNFKMFPLH